MGREGKGGREGDGGREKRGGGRGRDEGGGDEREVKLTMSHKTCINPYYITYVPFGYIIYISSNHLIPILR